MKKKILAILLTLAMALALAACGEKRDTEKNDPPASGGQHTESNQDPGDVQQPEGGDNDIEQPGQAEPNGSGEGENVTSDDGQEPAEPDVSTVPEKVEFQPNQDLKVVMGFTYSNHTYIIFENVGETPILDFSVAYMGFDKNGFLTTTDRNGYESGKCEAANLMPGDKTAPSWYGSSGTYIVAAVKSVKYSDGTEWEAQNLNMWAEETKSGFSTDSYLESLQNLKETGALAETNEYVTLSNLTMKHRNQFSNDYDFDFTLTNTGSQGVAKVAIFVLEFDENGFPVSVSPYDTYCLNGHATGGSVNLAVGATDTYTDNLFISGTTKNLKAVVEMIQFQDGSEWTNPYFYEWVISNNSAY